MNPKIKTFLFLSLLFSVFIPDKLLSQKNSETDLHKRQLNGKVKVLISKSYKIKDSTGLPVLHGTDTIWFNKHGFITKEIGGDSTQKLDYYSICNYDPTGKRLLRERNYEGPHKKKLDETRNQYNAAGNCSLSVSIDWEEKSADRTKYFYDSKGHLIRTMSESSDHLVPLKYKPYFQNKRIFKYDSLDRVIQNELFENKGQSANTTNYYYSDSVNLIVTKSKNQDSSVMRMNDKGQILSYRLFMRNSVYSGDDRIYDENARLIKLVSFVVYENKKDEYRFIIMELDEKKNWKKEQRYVNGIAEGYYEQEIYYYK